MRSEVKLVSFLVQAMTQNEDRSEIREVWLRLEKAVFLSRSNNNNRYIRRLSPAIRKSLAVCPKSGIELSKLYKHTRVTRQRRDEELEVVCKCTTTW